MKRLLISLALVLAAGLSAQLVTSPGGSGGGGGGGGITTYADTYANLGTTAASPSAGDVYFPTDSIYEALRYDGANWDHFVDGIEVTPCAIADFSWINQDDATAVETYGGVTMTPQTTVDDWDLNMLNRATPATPWSFEVGVSLTGSSDDSLSQIASLYVRESGTSEIVDFGRLTDGNISLFNSTNYTAPGTALGNNFQNDWVVNTAQRKVYLRIRDDGSSRYFEASADMRQWYQVHSEGTSDHLAEDGMGIGVARNSGTATWSAHFFHCAVN